MLFGSVPAAMQTFAYPIILLGVGGFVVFGYMALVALHPTTLNISIPADESCAGEEAIGVLMFLLKVLLRLAPVAFGAGVLCGAMLMGYACYQVSFAGESVFVGLMSAMVARVILVGFAVLPLAVFLLFLLYSLSVDLCRAILILPGKIDKLAEKDDEKKSGQ
jgi:hypothetical protein